MKNATSGKSPSLTTGDIFGIFYQEAKIIAQTEDEAQRLTNDAVTEFMGHYRFIKKRTRRTLKLETGLAL